MIELSNETNFDDLIYYFQDDETSGSLSQHCKDELAVNDGNNAGFNYANNTESFDFK